MPLAFSATGKHGLTTNEVEVFGKAVRLVGGPSGSEKIKV